MKKDKVKLSVVSYLNSKPFLFGLEHSDSGKVFSISKDIPSVCAQKLLQHEVEIGLIPVAMYPFLKEAQLITSFCIAADGPVESVLLVSQKPLPEIKEVILDTESRTSVLLAQLLAKEHWNIQPEWIPQGIEHDFSKPDEIGAAVIIGDKALRYKTRYRYSYDLAQGWKEMTGLPFVFAVWVSNTKTDPGIEEQLEEAFGLGIRTLADQLPELQKEYNGIDVRDYLTNKIRYRMGETEKKSMQLFLQKIQNQHHEKSGSVVPAVHIK